MKLWLVALLFVCGVLARDDLKIEVERGEYELDVDIDDRGKFELRAQRKDKVSEEEIRFKLEGEDHGIDSLFEFKMDSASVEVDSKFRTKIYRLVEFVDVGPAGYDAGDEVAQSWNMENEDFYSLMEGETPSGQLLNGTQVNVPWKSVMYTAADASSFAAKAYYTEKAALVGASQAQVSMASIKLDFIITNFPYTREDTKLAIEGRFKSREKVEEEGGPEVKTKIDTGNGLTSAGFTWATVVNVDGEEVDLIQSAVTQVSADDKDSTTGDDLEYSTYWTVDKVGQHSVITWDPIIGLAETSNSAVLTPALLLALFYML
jgi:hypothetical protein